MWNVGDYAIVRGNPFANNKNSKPVYLLKLVKVVTSKDFLWKIVRKEGAFHRDPEVVYYGARHVLHITRYFTNPLQPTQNELDMFEMLFDTKTKNDLLELLEEIK